MFYDVRIFDGKGNLKRVVTSNISSKRYWQNFFNIQFNPKTPIKVGARKSRMARLDWDYDDRFFIDE